jgi:predicted small secreted protein
MKHALIAASLVLVAGTVAGCGGDSSSQDKAAPSGPPTDASVSEFCGTFKSIGQDVAKLGKDAKDTEIVAALKKAGTQLDDTGTPTSISSSARQGFEITVKLIEDLDDNATQADIGKIDDGLSATQKKQETAFNEYVAKTCKM